ncbi:hypothetical protein MHU86_16538 [Fragilaria crotonensis]|nr:hypothetical protein MHU86_16538 [Fragilaria crotonensis]
MGSGAALPRGGSPSASGGGGARSGRKGQPADAVTNPQQDLFTKDANDVWQVFLDHVRSGPLPNMCCRWHLNGKCVRSCFLSASHVALTTEQTASPSRWSFDHEAAHREFHNRRTTGDAPPFRDSRQPTDGPIAGPSIAIPAAQPRPTATIATHETSLAAATPPRPARPPTTVRRGADRPGTANEDVRLTSRLLDTPSGGPRTNASSTPQPTTHPTEFRFEWTHEAAAHNLAVLRRYALDLGAAVDAQPFSAVTRIRISIRRAPGAAPLRTPALVALPRAHFRRRGFSREISDADRLADVRDNLARGNHKSARGHEAKLISMLKKKWKGAGNCPYRGGRSGIRRLRGGAFGHGGTDIDRREGTDHREAKAHTTSHSTPAGSQDEA